MKTVLGALLALSLAGCAAPYQPVPVGYTGAVATIADNGFPDGGGTAQIFSLIEIDGNAVANSFTASSNASSGQAFSLTTRLVQRQVPAKPMMVKLRASHLSAASIQTMFRGAAGRIYSVEGVVSFTPGQDRKYVVVGVLRKTGSTVWIQDLETGAAVSEKITAP